MRKSTNKLFSLLMSCFIAIFSFEQAAAQQEANAFKWPVDKYTVDGYYFGDPNGGTGVHVGEDIILDPGTPVRAIANGDVKLVKTNSDGYEQVVVIEHTLATGEKICSIYGHLSERSGYPLTTTGPIDIGDIVGYVGWDDENGIGGPHLHLGIRKGAYVGLYEGRATNTNDFYEPSSFIQGHYCLYHTPGSVVRTQPNPDLYLLDNGQKRKFDSFNVWVGNGQPDALVVYIGQEEMDYYSVGNNVLYPDNNYASNFLRDPDDRLFKVNGQGSTIWLWDSSQGKKRMFILEQVYHSWNYPADFSTAEDLNSWEHPANQTEGEQVHFRDGTLIKGDGSSTVYVVSNGQLRAFESDAIFNALEYNWLNIVELPQSNINNQDGFNGYGTMLTAENIWQEGEYQVVIAAGVYTPQNLSANSVSSSRIDLVWEDLNNPSGTEYKIYYSSGTYIGSTFNLSYSVTGLSASTNYSFQVSAVYNGDESAKSNTASASTYSSGGDPPPPQPNNFPVTVEAEEMYGVGIDVPGGKQLVGANWYILYYMDFPEIGWVEFEVIAKADSQVSGTWPEVIVKYTNTPAQEVSSTEYNSYFFVRQVFVSGEGGMEINLITGTAGHSIIVDKTIVRYISEPTPPTPVDTLVTIIYTDKDTYYGTIYSQDGNPDSDQLAFGGWGDWYYSFIEWDLTGAPSADDVIKAEACFTVKGAQTTGNDADHQLQRVTQTWQENTVSKTNYPGTATEDAADMPNTSLASTGDIESGDITNIYKDWMNGVYPNYGLKISSLNNDHTNHSYYSSDYTQNSSYAPYLKITYTVPSGSTDPAVLNVSTNTLNFGTSLTELNFSISNDGEDTLHINSIIGNETWISFISPTSGSLLAGENMSVNVVVDRSSLSAGDYTGSITISSNVGDENITVNVTKEASGNILSNADFETGNFSDWNPYSQNGSVIIDNQTALGVYSAKLSVSTAGEYWETSLTQLIPIESGKEYRVTFKAKASLTRKIAVNLTENGGAWTWYGLWYEPDLTTSWQEYQITFTANATDAAASFVFQTGAYTGDVWIDDILLEDISQTIPPSNNLLSNNGFESGSLSPWSAYANYGSATVNNTTAAQGTYSFQGVVGTAGESWEAELNQLIPVESGVEYTLSFYAKASAARSLTANLTEDGGAWTWYGLWYTVSLTTDWQYFETTFTANTTDESANFHFPFGDELPTVWIDELSIQETSLLQKKSINQPIFTIESSVPDEFELNQNYPNPFNPQTTIQYQLPEAASVSFKIYNALGQQVAVLEDNNYREAGYYQVNWKPINLSSGIYFYHLKAGKYEQIKKLMLVR